MKKVGLFLGLALVALTSFAQNTEQQALTLTLEQALEIALTESPAIKIAEQEIEIKRYAKQEAYSSLHTAPCAYDLPHCRQQDSYAGYDALGWRVDAYMHRGMRYRSTQWYDVAYKHHHLATRYSYHHICRTS